MDICSICQEIPFLRLPFEEEPAYPHHQSVPQLIASSASCSLCRLILHAINDLQDDVLKGKAYPPGLPLNYLEAGSEYGDRVNHDRYRITQKRTGILAKDKIEQEITYSSKLLHRFQETLGKDGVVGRAFPFELFQSQQQGIGATMRPWIYGNWWAFPHPKSPFQLIGFGVRLGRGPHIHDALGNESGRIYFRGSSFRLFTERTSTLASLIPGRRFNIDQRAGLIFEWIEEWLSLCSKNHTCACLETTLPTRVLDLSTVSGSNTIRLSETHGMSARYIALSHSWGKSPIQTMTTSETLRAHLQGIPISTLPKTFRDAIIITKRLKIRYLWIDSLCIIQGSSEDWERESARMNDIYSKSYLTIAASGSVDSNTGCFQPQPIPTQVPSDCKSTGFAETRTTAAQIQTEISGLGSSTIYVSREWMPTSSWQKTPRIYQIGSFGTYFDPVGEQPLNSRGWTLQERYLSPRVLHYSTDQLYVQCKEGIYAQDGAYFSNIYTISSVIDRQTSKVMPPPSTGRIISTTPVLSIPELSSAARNRQKAGWPFVVEQYSRKDLTFETDKLPALAGLASEIAHKTGDAYLAGLWKNTILEGLLWRIYLREEVELVHDDSLSPRQAVTFGRKLSDFRCPSIDRAPSWSWASVDASIHFETIKSDHVVAQYIDHDLEPIGRDIYGGLKPGGWLSIRGPLFEVNEDAIGNFCQNRTGVLIDYRGEISKGTAFFDQASHFPCFALFVDSETALLLERTSKEDSKFRRIGLGLFVRTAGQASRIKVISPVIRSLTAGPVNRNDECTTIIIV